MKISVETAALVTGAGSGIGRAVCMELGRRGARVTVVDFSKKDGEETVRLLIDQRRELFPNDDGGAPAAQFALCDVSNAEQLAAAFAAHARAYGRLDACVNNAGIGDREWFIDDASSDGRGFWRKVVAVDLVAVIDGTRLAIRAMQKARSRGAIVNIASAAGLYPAPNGPVYSGSKGGVVMFTRSLAHLSRAGIRVNAFCPEYTETPLLTQVSGPAAKQLPGVIQALGGYIPMATIVDGILELVEDESKAGDCLWVTNRKGKVYWPSEEEKQKYLVPGDPTYRPGAKRQVAAQGPPPPAFKKMVVRQLSTDFRAATEIVSAPLPTAVPRGAVLIKYLYAGVNASDINYSAGRYFGSPEAASKLLPFDAGFEAVGVVVAVGEGVKGPWRPGSPVATLSYGGFAEYAKVDARQAIPVDAPTPQTVAMLTSGLTASIGLEQAGRMGTGEKVLVTAAAGGTGQFAVQLAKLAGNHVVATCGGAEKAHVLRGLGVDRVIDYKQEDVGKVLKAEYPDGVDLVYESVGGAMFQTCVNALARFGRCVVIGMMSQYTAGEKSDWAPAQHSGLCEKLLWKSQTLSGFFLVHYAAQWKRHLAKLGALHKAGLLKVAIDPTDFCGLSSVPDAVEYLHSGRSAGKVVVRISADAPPVQSSRL